MSTTRRGGYAKGRERRGAILHAAGEIFAAQGFHKAALSTIAKQIGLSEPGLLHHFPSLGLCRENEDTPGLVRLFAILAAESVDDDHPAHDWMVERYRTLRERFEARIAREQQDGHIDPGLGPQRLAPQLIAMFDGLQVQWLLDPDAVDMAAVFEDFLDRLRPQRG